MNQVRAITAIARADFLERVRRYSFLLTLLFATFLGYAAATGRIMIQLGGHRGVYTSAWVGALVALVTTCWVSLVGFYIVKGGIDRDRQTGVGQVLAATPLSKPAYTLGKFLSNFAVLGSMVLVLALAAVVMQIFVHEDSHLDFFALLSPFVVVALPAMLLTAAVAVLFETLPVLRGGVGNVVWFFVWAFLGVALSAITGIEWLDPLGNMTMAHSMQQGAWAHIPDYKGGFAFTIADKPVEVVQSFRWEGVPWTASQILLRLAWCGVAIVLVLFAAAVFDRFDSAGWLGSIAKKSGARSGGQCICEWRVCERRRVGKRHNVRFGGVLDGGRVDWSCLDFYAADYGEDRARRVDGVTCERSQQCICAVVCRGAEARGERFALVVVRGGCGIADCAGYCAVGGGATAIARDFVAMARACVVIDGRARNALWDASAPVFVGADFAASTFGVLARGIRARNCVWLGCGTAHSCDARCRCAAAVGCGRCAFAFNGARTWSLERDVEAIRGNFDGDVVYRADQSRQWN